MGKLCLHASSFIFYQIIIKVVGNQDRHESSVEFDFGPNQTTHFGVTCPWVTKISHFWTWISLKPVGQSWSNFMCSIIGVEKRLHKVLGQTDLGTLDSGERSLPFGLLFFKLAVKEDRHKIWNYSNFGQIRPLPMELGALEHLKNFPQTYDGENCVQAKLVHFLSSSNLLVMRTGIKSRTSSNSGRIRHSLWSCMPLTEFSLGFWK